MPTAFFRRVNPSDQVRELREAKEKRRQKKADKQAQNEADDSDQLTLEDTK